MIPPHVAKKIPKDRIFARPARKVLTNKSNQPGELEAKSRVVLPGDVDPDGHLPIEEGGFRTDAPTTTQLAFHVFCSNCVRRRWKI